ncbi:hypothetical protein VCRA2119O147_340031 [Vibrio crassostreae]|nr:hypothetical protein VCRA2119O147_340031 [Vibrio crassostreae]CAK2811949.1 hypothetical protein VCRA2110O183_310031 [Vibrio crassostreae]CAK2896172.1 hypothetical protein VCRA2121O264_310031 [Vibrio crassostreae]CAK3565479.1 hypothetical protein VCRA2121O262_320036 [Vibrio crassostreae]
MHNDALIYNIALIVPVDNCVSQLIKVGQGFKGKIEGKQNS